MFNYLLMHSPLVYLTQSFWRDEAFSAFFAQQSIWDIIVKSYSEPPLYYILLHFWMMIFGSGELAIRSFSLIGFLCAGIAVIYLAEHVFRKHWVSWFVPVLFFLNPMLLIYAFEARAYGWYAFFAVLTIYAYMRKKWGLFIAASILGIYTHLYMVFVPFVCLAHTWITDPQIRKKGGFRLPVVTAFYPILLCVSPWVIYFLQHLKQMGAFWYFPVDTRTILSALGNMYTGYEGTPWYLWNMTAWLSVGLLLFSAVSLIPKHNRKDASLFLLMAFLPLCSILGISLIKPLFVNRYLLPVTIAEIFIIGYGILAFRQKWMQILLATICVIGTAWFTFWFPAQHAKTDYRTPMMEIQTMLGQNDVIYADDAIIYFETKYYAKDKSRVFLYNPNDKPFPWYVGDSMFDVKSQTKSLPQYPIKAFILHTDTSYTVNYLLPMAAKPK